MKTGNNLLKNLSVVFFTGLVAVLPVFATIYVLFWLMVTVETLLGKGVRLIFPDYYMPGMGVAASIVIIFLAGILMRTLMMRKLFEWGTGLLDKIPIVKTIYGAFKDLMQFISTSGNTKNEEKQVVMVRVGEPEIEIMGFVTRRDFKGLPAEIGKASHIAVYVPMSYQIGGHTIIVPSSLVRPVEMSMEQAMRFVLTAGMTTERSNSK